MAVYFYKSYNIFVSQNTNDEKNVKPYYTLKCLIRDLPDLPSFFIFCTVGGMR